MAHRTDTPAQVNGLETLAAQIVNQALGTDVVRGVRGQARALWRVNVARSKHQQRTRHVHRSAEHISMGRPARDPDS